MYHGKECGYCAEKDAEIAKLKAELAQTTLELNHFRSFLGQQVTFSHGKNDAIIEFIDVPVQNAEPEAVQVKSRSMSPALGNVGAPRDVAPMPEEMNYAAKGGEIAFGHVDGLDVAQAEILEIMCGICRDIFSDPESFNAHFVNHSSAEAAPTTDGDIIRASLSDFTCPNCQQRFELATGLKEHMLVCKARCECLICGETFAERQSFREHLQKHPGMKIYECELCCKAFGDTASYNRHIVELHADRASTICDVCGKNVSLQAYAAHRKQHASEEWKCKVCPKSFPSLQEYNQHMKVSHVNGEKPGALECSVCKKVFSAQNQLTKHMQIHSADKKFQCDLCGKNFALNGYLKKHLKKVHGTVSA
ncbi:zinc finger protein 570-like [Phlebotomus argentipes]|uniref:zinc finger protein 570-like n=1 Tax=Phlebotomus argentipes TaxID=94469 RepID=UPI002892C8C7|nr:zinc finger protein 570-like [Phlebotomus argentipes]